MADLGFYNFVQGALAEGKTKEVVAATLAGNGLDQAAIDELFTAVQHGKKPGPAQPHARKKSGWIGILAIIVVLAAVLTGTYLFATGQVPSSHTASQGSISTCADADTCVRSDIDTINAQASKLFSLDQSYDSLCAGGSINMEAATGTSAQATDIDSALRNAVDGILQARNVTSQGDAGVQCGASGSRYYVSAAMSASSTGSYYCLDSRGVATTSAPNPSTTFCGSALSSF